MHFRPLYSTIYVKINNFTIIYLTISDIIIKESDKVVQFNNQTRLKNFIKGIIIITIYFIVSFLKNTPLIILNIDYDALATIYKEIYSISIEIFLLLIIFYTFKKK